MDNYQVKVSIATGRNFITDYWHLAAKNGASFSFNRILRLTLCYSLRSLLCKMSQSFVSSSDCSIYYIQALRIFSTCMAHKSQCILLKLRASKNWRNLILVFQTFYSSKCDTKVRQNEFVRNVRRKKKRNVLSKVLQELEKTKCDSSISMEFRPLSEQPDHGDG